MLILWLLACAPSPSAPVAPEAAPRTPAAACARLDAIDAPCTHCDGGNQGDEVSYVCVGTLDGRAYTLDAVTTGAPLPPPDDGVGRMVDDLWVEARVGSDRHAAEALLERWAP